jgi:hypothetical protein
MQDKPKPTMKTIKLRRCCRHRATLGLLLAALPLAAFAQTAMPPSEILEKLMTIFGSTK